MTVYVDDMSAKYGRMLMFHMVADTDAELHDMAAAIGVARRWHQAPPRHDSHYDIAKGKKQLAHNLGAVAITWRQCGCMCMRRRITGELGPPGEAVDWVRKHKELNK